MRIAITGVAGLIGGTVARRLARDGHDLVCFDQRDPDLPLPGTFVRCDGRDRAAIEPAMRGVECACHIGEVPNVNNRFGLSPDQVRETNVALCRTMLDASLAVGARRMVYTSSCQVYGFWGGEMPRGLRPSVWPIDETQPLAPQNAYAESKSINESQCERVSRETALETIRFRFPWVVGPRQVEGGLRRAERADHELFEGFWTYLDVRDAAEAYVAAVGAERPFSGLDERSMAFHFVADRVWGERPVRERLAAFRPDFPSLPADWPALAPPVTCARAETYLGWRPAHHFEPAATSGRTPRQTGEQISR